MVLAIKRFGKRVGDAARAGLSKMQTRKACRHEPGQTTMEWVIIGGVIVVIAVVAFSGVLKPAITGLIDKMAESIKTITGQI